MAISSGRRGTKPYDEYEYYGDGLFNSWLDWIGLASTLNDRTLRYKQMDKWIKNGIKNNASYVDTFKSNTPIFYIEQGFNKMV